MESKVIQSYNRWFDLAYGHSTLGYAEITKSTGCCLELFNMQEKEDTIALVKKYGKPRSFAETTAGWNIGMKIIKRKKII